MSLGNNSSLEYMLRKPVPRSSWRGVSKRFRLAWRLIHHSFQILQQFQSPPNELSIAFAFSFKETSHVISALSPDDKLQMRHFGLKYFRLEEIIYPSRELSSLTQHLGTRELSSRSNTFLHFKEIPQRKLALPDVYVKYRERMLLF